MQVMMRYADGQSQTYDINPGSWDEIGKCFCFTANGMYHQISRSMIVQCIVAYTGDAVSPLLAKRIAKSTKQRT